MAVEQHPGPLLPLAELASHHTDVKPHLWRLHRLVVENAYQVVVELGTRHGYSTGALAHGVAITGGHVWAVDVQESEPFACPLVTFLHGDDRDLGVQAQVPAVIDLLYVDTSHELAHTVLELEAYGLRVRDGGMVVCHDTCLPGVHVPLRAFYEQRGCEWREWREFYGLAAVTIGAAATF